MTEIAAAIDETRIAGRIGGPGAAATELVLKSSEFRKGRERSEERRVGKEC